MAAEALTYKIFNDMHIVPAIVKVKTTEASDWINLTQFKGVFPLGSFMLASSTNNEAPDLAVPQYGKALSTAVYADVTTTQVVVDGAAADATNTRSVPFYAKCTNGEIVEVIGDSAPEAVTATWTLRRGCLGTTAAAIADNDYFVILNQLVFSSTRFGDATGVVLPYPNDPGVGLFI
jgi:hypothetical protein